MTLRTVLAALLLTLLSVAGFAEGRGSASDQDACRPDVFRLCADAIPDEAEIVSCLNRRASELDPACRSVIDPMPTHRKRRAMPTASRGA